MKQPKNGNNPTFLKKLSPARIFIRVGLIILLCLIGFYLHKLPNTRKIKDFKPVKNTIIKAVEAGDILTLLKEIKDPEIGLNIVDLGLVRKVNLNKSGEAYITLIPTSPFCPFLDILVLEIKEHIKKASDIKRVEINIDWKTPWHPGMVSQEGRKKLEKLFNDS
ncbi:MAG: metal-sulfur cluster assembly factor [Candidatus Omnitrophica bacterium]|nr:metal-sulfur cluster assembly factor [Candidatus Omnitrophota bacterium]